MIRFIAISFVLLVAACAQTPPTQFYTLASLSQPQSSEAASEGITLALAPVSLPAYLDRPQIVTRLDATRMQIADFENWIEPLDSLIQRTLASNLQSDAGIRQVIRLPQRYTVEFDRGVEINLSRFETDQEGVAWIDADWLVIDGKERKLARRTFARQEPVPEPRSMAERSLAMSTLLDELSEAIIDSLEPGSAQ